MKILRSIIGMAFDILILVGVFLILLRIRGISFYVVQSGSMEPAIPAGGIVFTDTREKNPDAGTIITFRLGDQTVTHRIVREEKGVWITKGDANEREDPVPVSFQQLIGTVVCSLPYLGYAVAWLQALPPAYLILIILILSFFLNFRISLKNPITERRACAEARGKHQ